MVFVYYPGWAGFTVCDRTVRPDELAMLTEETKPAVPTLNASQEMRFMSQLWI